MYADIAAEAVREAPGEWSCHRGAAWCNAWHGAGPQLPAQGWKLHVSAALPDAEAVLRRTLPILLDSGQAWKVAVDDVQLSILNYGFASLSQVGKFITVFPTSNEVAVDVAQRLDDATAGLRGPFVPSDRPLHHESLVSYRFGAFQQRSAGATDGLAVGLIEGPDGPEPDLRHALYRRPRWLTDPGSRESSQSRTDLLNDAKLCGMGGAPVLAGGGVRADQQWACRLQSVPRHSGR